MKDVRNIWLVVVMVALICILGIYKNANANYNWSENLDFKGIHFNASAGNSDDTAYADSWGWLEQGIEGRYYQYQNSNMNFFTNSEDTSEFYFDASWSFLILPLSAYVPDFDIDASQGSSFNAFGVSFYMQSEVRNAVEWVIEEPENPDSDWYPVVTDDIEISSHFSLEPARITNINLYVNEWTWEKDEGELVQNVLGISFNGRGHFIAPTEEEADALGAMFQIPEPATISALALGGIFLRNLRKKK